MSRDIIETPYKSHANNQKYQAVVVYTQCGNKHATAAAVGVLEETLRGWMKESWWKEAESEILNSRRTELSSNLQKVVNKALEIVHDRLENGDFFFDQKGQELVRRPVSAGTAATILKDSVDRVINLERLGNEDRQTVAAEKFEDHLKKLQEEFQRFARATTIEGEVVKA